MEKEDNSIMKTNSKRILVTSDSHRNIEILEELANKHPNCDYYLDAGDSERYDIELLPFLSVKGNMDYHIKTNFRIIDVDDNYKIYLFHGDKYFLSLNTLADLAKKNNCNIIIHGHIHKPYYQFHDGVHIMCPGSVSYPRSSDGATYIVLNIKNNLEVEIHKV